MMNQRLKRGLISLLAPTFFFSASFVSAAASQDPLVIGVVFATKVKTLKSVGPRVETKSVDASTYVYSESTDQSLVSTGKANATSTAAGRQSLTGVSNISSESTEKSQMHSLVEVDQARAGAGSVAAGDSRSTGVLSSQGDQSFKGTQSSTRQFSSSTSESTVERLNAAQAGRSETYYSSSVTNEATTTYFSDDTRKSPYQADFIAAQLNKAFADVSTRFRLDSDFEDDACVKAVLVADSLKTNEAVRASDVEAFGTVRSDRIRRAEGIGRSCGGTFISETTVVIGVAVPDDRAGKRVVVTVSSSMREFQSGAASTVFQSNVGPVDAYGKTDLEAEERALKIAMSRLSDDLKQYFERSVYRAVPLP